MNAKCDTQRNDLFSITIVTTGKFGSVVGHAISEALPMSAVRICEVDQAIDRFMAHPTEAIILASWRPDPFLSDQLQVLADKFAAAFIPLTVDCSHIRLGPVTLPGKPGCWDCWMRRQRQHDANPHERKLLLEYYSSNPHRGPEGFLYSYAVMAASVIRGALTQLRQETLQGGYILEIDITTKRISTSTLIPVNDCTRCGLKRCAVKRTYEELHENLRYLWWPSSLPATAEI